MAFFPVLRGFLRGFWAWMDKFLKMEKTTVEFLKIEIPRVELLDFGLGREFGLILD